MDRALCWVFKMRSGAVEEFPGTEIRELRERFEVYRETTLTGFVLKTEVVDHWVENQEFTGRAK